MLTGAHNYEAVSIPLGHRLLLSLIALASDNQHEACGIAAFVEQHAATPI